MSVKLPLLAEPQARAQAASPRSTAIEPQARALATRTWVAVIGAPADEAPVRFACAFASALAAGARYALLSARAPDAVEHALRAAGCQSIRSDEPIAEQALQRALSAVPADAIVLVVESELAARLRGALDVWIGAAPSIGLDDQLLRLYAAADVVLPSTALGTAVTMAAVLGPRLAAPFSDPSARRSGTRIKPHTNAA